MEKENKNIKKEENEITKKEVKKEKQKIYMPINDENKNNEESNEYNLKILNKELIRIKIDGDNYLKKNYMMNQLINIKNLIR